LRFAGVAALALAGPCIGSASAAMATDSHAAPPPAIADMTGLHGFMRSVTGEDGYLGAVTLIARDGRIVDWQAYGHRDLARREPMRRDAIFRLYSMTKTITSAALMLLVEQGRIGLDDPVSAYLPELARPQVVVGGHIDAPRLRDAASEISIRQLLTHTAGFPAGLEGDELATAILRRRDPHAAADLQGFVERLSRAALAADPGTRFGYDGTALEVLARVIEVVAEQPFDAFLHDRIFVPLDMRDSGFEVSPSQRERVVDITRMDDDGRLRIADGPSAREPGARLNAYPSGAGGLYSTARDYARFAQMLLDGGLIAAPSDAPPAADAPATFASRHAGPSGPAASSPGPSTRPRPRLLRADTVAAMLRNQLGMLDPPVNQYSAGEGFGFGGYVVIDPAKRDRPGSRGQFGWSGAASTTYAIDPRQRLIAIALLQHLPHGEARRDLPRIGSDFYRQVYRALDIPATAEAETTK
jgi:CubicO group peptidase (beta-lactamase class C family)